VVVSTSVQIEALHGLRLARAQPWVVLIQVKSAIASPFTAEGADVEVGDEPKGAEGRVFLLEEGSRLRLQPASSPTEMSRTTPKRPRFTAESCPTRTSVGHSLVKKGFSCHRRQLRSRWTDHLLNGHP
jgi:hypothetical protein